MSGKREIERAGRDVGDLRGYVVYMDKKVVGALEEAARGLGCEPDVLLNRAIKELLEGWGIDTPEWLLDSELVKAAQRYRHGEGLEPQVIQYGIDPIDGLWI